MKEHLPPRGKTFALLAMFLLVQAYGIAQEIIPLIPDPLLAVVMAENSRKFVILLFHRNGPESGAMGALVANAIMRDPILARRALFASAEISEPNHAMLAKDLDITSFPTLAVASVHKGAGTSVDVKVYTRAKVNLDANSLHSEVMLSLCLSKEAAQQPYFDAGMRTACDGYLKRLTSLPDPKVPEPPPSPGLPLRARFSKKPVNPMKAALESSPSLPYGRPDNTLLSSSSIPNGPPPPADVGLPRASVDPGAAHLRGVWKGQARINICGKPSGTADVTLLLEDAGLWAGIWGDKNQQKGRVTGALIVNGAPQGSVIAMYGHARLETDDLATATRALRGGLGSEKYSPYALRFTAEDPYWYVGYYQTLTGILHQPSAGCSHWLDRGETLGVTLRKQ